LSTTGRVSVYDQGGYIQNFGPTAANFSDEIQALKDG